MLTITNSRSRDIQSTAGTIGIVSNYTEIEKEGSSGRLFKREHYAQENGPWGFIFVCFDEPVSFIRVTLQEYG